MNQFFKSTVLLLALSLTACESGSVQETLGLNRDAPDEFTVVSRPPLSVPPEFSLRPPRPGEPPRGMGAEDQARSLITGKTPAPSDPFAIEAPTVETAVTPVVRNDALSEGANSLLKRAGASNADTSIREKLGADASRPAPSGKADSLLDAVVGTEKAEPTVDAAKEAERLRANKQAGKPVTEGDVPEEKPKKPSLVDRIF